MRSETHVSDQLHWPGVRLQLGRLIPCSKSFKLPVGQTYMALNRAPLILVRCGDWDDRNLVGAEVVGKGRKALAYRLRSK